MHCPSTPWFIFTAYYYKCIFYGETTWLMSAQQHYQIDREGTHRLEYYRTISQTPIDCMYIHIVTTFTNDNAYVK